jgi:hypothetical protein
VVGLEDGDELRHAYGLREGKVAYAAATIASPALLHNNHFVLCRDIELP